MSASNSLAGPLRRLSAHLLGGSLKEVSKAVSLRKKEKKMFIVMTPFDTVRLLPWHKNMLLQGLTFRQSASKDF